MDRENRNTLWMDALAKETYEVGVEFKILEDDENLTGGYSQPSEHIIFDVKMDFT